MKNIIFGLSSVAHGQIVREGLTKYFRPFKSMPETFLLMNMETEVINYKLNRTNKGEDWDCNIHNIKLAQSKDADGTIDGYKGGACMFVNE